MDFGNATIKGTIVNLHTAECSDCEKKQLFAFYKSSGPEETNAVATCSCGKTMEWNGEAKGGVIR